MTGDWILCVSQGFYCGSEGHYEDRGGQVESLATTLEEAQPESEEEWVVMRRPDLCEGRRRRQSPRRCPLQALCPPLLKPQSRAAACRRRAPGKTLGFGSHQPGGPPPPRPPCGENAVGL